MSTQDRGIPLYNTPDNVGYRLLELPPDLEKLLESDDPPPMTLQSTDTAAVLSTPGKLYSLRQKGTSNALILLRPHQPDAASPEQGMAVVSEIREFVELEPVEGGEKVSEKASVAKGKWHEKFGRTR